MTEPKTDRLVEVRWEDSASKHGWNEEPAKVTDCLSVGFVQEDDDKGIVLVESIVLGSEPGLQRLGCSMAIPRSAIRKVTELRRGR